MMVVYGRHLTPCEWEPLEKKRTSCPKIFSGIHYRNLQIVEMDLFICHGQVLLESPWGLKHMDGDRIVTFSRAPSLSPMLDVV